MDGLIRDHRRRTLMEKAEPPSCLKPPLFMVGQDSRGSWVVQEPSGLCGGLFVNLAQALKFARSENRNQPHKVVLVSEILELDMMSAPQTTPRVQLNDSASRQRRVA
jgi:hypothetical protein